MASIRYGFTVAIEVFKRQNSDVKGPVARSSSPPRRAGRDNGGNQRCCDPPCPCGPSRSLFLDCGARPENRFVSALRQLDDQRIRAAFGGVVLVQSCPEPHGLGPHDGVQFGIVARVTPEHLDADDRFFELVVPALEMPLNKESKELGLPVVPCKGSTRKEVLQFLANGLIL